nr:TPA: hypothetical protein BN1204_048520 [Neospora caninum Liverpool]
MLSASGEDGTGSGTSSGTEEDRGCPHISFLDLGDASQTDTSGPEPGLAGGAPLRMPVRVRLEHSERTRNPSLDSTQSRSSGTTSTAGGALGNPVREEVRRQRAALQSFRKRVQSVVESMEEVQIKADKEARRQMDGDIERSLRDPLRALSRRWHRRVLQACEDLVPANWAIEDKDTLVKRMRLTKPATVDREGDEESFDEADYWQGPSPEDVFGADRIIATKTLYELLAVYTRRTWSASVPTAFVRRQVDEKSRWGQGAGDESPLGATLVRKTLPVQAVGGPPKKDVAPDDSEGGEASARPPPRMHVRYEGSRNFYDPAFLDGTDIERHIGVLGQCVQSCSGCRPRPSPFPLSALNAEPPSGYSRAPVEDENVRIPSRLEDFLITAHVPIKRPSWDRRKTPLLSTLEVKKPDKKKSEELESEDLCGRDRERGGTLFCPSEEDWDILGNRGVFSRFAGSLDSWSIHQGKGTENLKRRARESNELGSSQDAPTQNAVPFSPVAAGRRYSRGSIESFDEERWGGASLEDARHSDAFEGGLWFDPDAYREYYAGWDGDDYLTGGPCGEGPEGGALRHQEGKGDSWMTRKFREVCGRLVPDVNDICKIPQKLRDSVAAVKRETENCIFDQTDIQVLEYWHLQREAGKPVWVYEGLQWDVPSNFRNQVPMEGRPATVKIEVPPEPEKTGPKKPFEKSILYQSQDKSRDISKSLSSCTMGDRFFSFGVRGVGEGSDVKGLVL